MRGTRRTMEKLISDETKRHAALTAARATYVAGVRQLEAELRTDPPPTPLNNAMSGALALAGYNWAVADGPRGSPEQLAALLRQAAANTSSPGAHAATGMHDPSSAALPVALPLLLLVRRAPWPPTGVCRPRPRPARSHHSVGHRGGGPLLFGLHGLGRGAVWRGCLPPAARGAQLGGGGALVAGLDGALRGRHPGAARGGGVGGWYEALQQPCCCCCCRAVHPAPAGPPAWGRARPNQPLPRPAFCPVPCAPSWPQGAYLVNPAAVAKVPLIAITSDQRNFYTQIPLWALAAAALGLAYSDCLVYQVGGTSSENNWRNHARATCEDRLPARQLACWLTSPLLPACLPTLQGLWLDTFSGWMGGSRDPFSLVDADLLADGVRASMGTLVGAPRLPAFLVVPGAALLAGLLQGAIFYGAQALRASDFM